MNLAFFLTIDVAYLYDDFSLRQGLEKMHHHGYTAIPVLNRENKYVGTVSEGDFLWYLVEGMKKRARNMDLKSMEDVMIRDIFALDKNPPVRITATMEELLIRAMNQNFVPVVDDTDTFVGIVTRRNIMNYFHEHSGEKAGENTDAPSN